MKVNNHLPSIRQEEVTIEPRGTFTRILAVAGTVLAWLPILATVLTGLIGSLMRRRFMVDYLMPAELCFFALLGNGLLLCAVLRAHSHRKLVGALTAHHRPDRLE